MPVGRRIIRCDICGRSEECSPEDLLRHTRRGWPKCCGRTMALFTETRTPQPNDTPPDTPQLSPADR